MEDRAEVIKQHMQEKRAELSEKLQTLEDKVTENLTGAEEKVAETVENVTENVQQTVASVTNNVQQTVESVKQALDLSHHVREHPWLAVGGAVVVGYLAYGFLRRGGLNLSLPAGLLGNASQDVSGVIGEQIQHLERFAAKTVLDLVESAVKESMPGQLGETAGEIVHSLATSLAGNSASNGAPAANQNGGPR